jgi:hypothetical protein
MDGQSIEFGKYILQIGGPMGALLVLFFYFYRKDMQYYTNEMKQVSDEWKGQTAILMQIVKENTAAFTKNTEVVQSLHRHMFDGDGRLKRDR